MGREQIFSSGLGPISTPRPDRTKASHLDEDGKDLGSGLRCSNNSYGGHGVSDLEEGKEEKEVVWVRIYISYSYDRNSGSQGILFSGDQSKSKKSSDLEKRRWNRSPTPDAASCDEYQARKVRGGSRNHLRSTMPCSEYFSDRDHSRSKSRSKRYTSREKRRTHSSHHEHKRKSHSSYDDDREDIDDFANFRKSKNKKRHSARSDEGKKHHQHRSRS